MAGYPAGAGRGTRFDRDAQRQPSLCLLYCDRSSHQMVRRSQTGERTGGPRKRITGTEKPVSPEQRRRLHVGPEVEVTYRHVELTCGEHVLVEAENWYVPSRVGPDINHLLITTDTPFGRAVRDLKPARENFSVEMFWKPLPDGWELAPPADENPWQPWRYPCGFSSIAP